MDEFYLKMILNKAASAGMRYICDDLSPIDEKYDALQKYLDGIIKEALEVW